MHACIYACGLLVVPLGPCGGLLVLAAWWLSLALHPPYAGGACLHALVGVCCLPRSLPELSSHPLDTLLRVVGWSLEVSWTRRTWDVPAPYVYTNTRARVST